MEIIITNDCPSSNDGNGEMGCRENCRNQDFTGDKELIVASFGTSFFETRIRTICAIEDRMEQEFPDFSIRRAFTSEMIIRKLKKSYNINIDNLEEALLRGLRNGVKEIVVQPTLLMDGIEYHKVNEIVDRFRSSFETVSVGAPLLNTRDDLFDLTKCLTDRLAQFDDGKTAVCLMGHGTEAQSNEVYAEFEQVLHEMGHKNYCIGTVEAKPNVYDLLNKIRGLDVNRVVLMPLMIVAGDHATNDMAGSDESSWKSIFEKAGYSVACVMEGLGEFQDVQNIFVRHVRALI